MLQNGTASAASGTAAGASRFEQALESALNDALTKAGIDPSTVQFTIDSGAATADAGAKAAAPKAVVTPFNQPYVAPKTAQQSTPKPATHWYASSPEDDAYWAKQPPAVQQLREIQDQDQRTKLAGQLAYEGYSIDVPIMAWGWDAAQVTQMRQAIGYTWVPTGLQANVQAAPGASGPTFAYDPKNPPPGSIAVG